MKKAKFLKTCREYDDLLKDNGYSIILKEPYTEFENSDMNHIRWMLNEIPNMIDDTNKLEKINRWIGFVQGVLWSKGYYTIEDMRGQSGDVDETEKPAIRKCEGYYYQFEGGISDMSL